MRSVIFVASISAVLAMASSASARTPHHPHGRGTVVTNHVSVQHAKKPSTGGYAPCPASVRLNGHDVCLGLNN